MALSNAKVSPYGEELRSRGGGRNRVMRWEMGFQLRLESLAVAPAVAAAKSKIAELAPKVA